MTPSRLPAWSAAVLMAAGLLCGCGSSTSAGGGPAGPGAVVSSPSQQVDALSLAALQDLASALGEQGHDEFKDTFGALKLDPAAGRVVLFATDEPRARALVAAAAQAHPGVETGRAEIRHTSYARATVDPALKRIGDAAQADSLPFPVYTAALRPDASGITVTTSHEGAASSALKKAVAELAGAVPVSYEEGKPVRNLDATAQLAPPP
ncbi:hypothetical protein ACFV6D_16170 [Kitasatospora sp. NPDC059812]|uniref:hypothetical protein n=1 Tax=Kitasatospora sp. NPDC059812 TaxID=3346958 RepID=UPI0036692F58